MHHPALLTVTRTLVVVVGSLGILAALVHDGGAEPVVLASATDGARPVVELPAPSITGAPAPSSSTTTPSSTTTATTSTTTTTSPPSTAPPTTPPPPTTAPPATAPPTTTAAPTTTPSASAQSCESDLARLVNEARTGRGLPAVAMDGAILDVARSWTRQLVSTGELRHNPDFASQVFGARPEARTAAENVGRTAGSAASLHQAFMDSAEHRGNILDPGHSHAAIGCSADQNGQLWATVDFWG